MHVPRLAFGPVTTVCDVADRPDVPIELIALLIARDEYPALDVARYLERLDELAAPLIDKLGDRGAIQADRLREHLYLTIGLRGAERDYYDPRNSYLNDVLDRRVGIPISLAAVVMAVGRRAGAEVEGIGFPGHFLLRVGGRRGVYLDPFSGGRQLEHAELVRLAKTYLGDASRLAPEHLAPVDNRAMAIRMLRNLKLVYERRADRARALIVCDRLCDLTGDVTVRRDRGLHALALGSKRVAHADLHAYLDACPQAPDARRMRQLVKQADQLDRVILH